MNAASLLPSSHRALTAATSSAGGLVVIAGGLVVIAGGLVVIAGGTPSIDVATVRFLSGFI